MIVITSAALFIVCVAGLGLWRRAKSKEENTTRLLEKYATLYKLLTNRRTAEIIKARPAQLVVSMHVKDAHHVLSLEEVDERLLISWHLNGSESNRATKEWSFNPNYPQIYMYEEVLKDITTFQLKNIRSQRSTPQNSQFQAA